MGTEKPNREMIRPLRRFTLCAAALLLAACGARPGTSLEEFRTTIYRPAYAAGFEIVGAEGLQSTILRTRTPWQGAAEGTATALFIARNGETPPAGFDGQTVEAGAPRIVCMSSTHVAMLDAVGAAPRIVGVSGRESIANGYVAAHPDRVGDVGYDGNVNYERLLSLRPDLVLLFGVNGASPMEPKLRELGIPFCYIGEYLEESPPGKADSSFDTPPILRICRFISMKSLSVRFARIMRSACFCSTSSCCTLTALSMRLTTSPIPRMRFAIRSGRSSSSESGSSPDGMNLICL